MANALYDLGREAFLGGDLDFDANTIKIWLGDTADYAVNLAAHQFFSSVPAGARVAISSALAGKTKAAGVADADDVLLTSVTGDASEHIGGYADSGTESSSRLIFYIDSATGLPVTPNGGNITVQWDSGVNRIFKL